MSSRAVFRSRNVRSRTPFGGRGPDAQRGTARIAQSHITSGQIATLYAARAVLSGTIAVRVSKDRYIAVTKTYETAYPGLQYLSFALDLSAGLVNIAGI
jgi:hypothetical protein